MREVVWEPQASDQLAEIIDYIAERNLAAAERLERQFHEKLEVASKMPRIGRPGRVEGTREIVVHRTILRSIG